MARTIIKTGDVFFAKLGDGGKKYFQYIGSDSTQLNSEVIRVFKTAYPTDSAPDLKEVARDDVEFCAHCVIKWGIELGYWEKAGNAPVSEGARALFRTSGDEPQTRVSDDWWVWEMNEERKHVGKLQGENQKAEIGSVIPPDSIVHRMRTSEYDFVYPGY